MSVHITKRYEWDMGHRLGKGYNSRCKNCHGHRYQAEMTFDCGAFDPYDMVVDFGEIKRVCGAWIDENIDHAMLVYSADAPLLEFLQTEGNRHHVVDFNTTVENITPWLAQKLQEAVDSVPDLNRRGVRLVELKVNETPNGWAVWRAE